jgi:hypothetical protein
MNKMEREKKRVFFDVLVGWYPRQMVFLALQKGQFPKNNH